MKHKVWVDKAYGEWVVLFKVGVQSIQVAKAQTRKVDALWYAKQFRGMLRKLTTEGSQ